ncbi:hypothetical protein CPB86DRAFT_547740 [Serendipita vermifera]|nr:hypothetical protein CPB86DRAFT_547740 [Serendipita vermifera]
MLARPTRLLQRACTTNAIIGVRAFHVTKARHGVTKFTMPAMSPTMTEGGIASWKKKEGDSFAAGDVLLEIETDKATIDVEAQEDGVLGKILAKEGERGIPVGKLIALLVEEGDDISNLEIPKDEEVAKPAEPTKPLQSEKQSDAPPTSSPASPNASSKHTSHIHVEGPVFPSVLRLLNEAGVEDYKKIKGTGVRGMLTKGDVLAFLGKASSPTGTYKIPPTTIGAPAPAAAAPPAKKEIKASFRIQGFVKSGLNQFQPVDALTLRQMIASGLSELSSTKATPKKSTPTFDDVVEDYLPKVPSSLSLPTLPPATTPPPPKSSWLDGLI